MRAIIWPNLAGRQASTRDISRPAAYSEWPVVGFQPIWTIRHLKNNDTGVIFLARARLRGPATLNRERFDGSHGEDHLYRT